MAKENKYLLYKGKPLVRNGNTLYYGNMGDPYVVMLQIMANENKNDIQTATKVIVQLMSTDRTKDIKDIFIKRSEKSGLYSAMEIASIWLERALEEA